MTRTSLQKIYHKNIPQNIYQKKYTTKNIEQKINNKKYTTKNTYNISNKCSTVIVLSNDVYIPTEHRIYDGYFQQ